MKGDPAFKALFSVDWLFGEGNVARLLPRRWDRLQQRMLAHASRNGEGGVYPVDRRHELTPQEFYEKYFLTGIPVVLEGRLRSGRQSRNGPRTI
jgi:hypothetical protein